MLLACLGELRRPLCADDVPFAAEGAVHGQRQTDGEAVHAAAGAARLVSFDDEVPVVLLDGKVKAMGGRRLGSGRAAGFIRLGG